MAQDPNEAKLGDGEEFLDDMGFMSDPDEGRG